MYILAPLVFTVGLSYLLYGTKELWKYEIYKMQNKGVDPVVAEDAVNLKKAVSKRQIDPQQATVLFESKYGEGASQGLQDQMESNR